MSLFPAYGPPGSSRRGQGGNSDNNKPSTSKDLFVIDRDGKGSSGGTSSDPILICGDDDEEGEVRTPEQSPPRGGSRSSKDKRKRSRSRSSSPGKKNKKKKHKSSKGRSPPSSSSRHDKKQDYNYQDRGGGRQNYDHEDNRTGGGGGYYDGRSASGSSSRGAYNNLYEMGRNDRGGRSYNDYGGGGAPMRTEFYGRQNPIVSHYNSQQNPDMMMDSNRGDRRNNQQQQGSGGGRDRARDQYYEDQRVNVAQRFPNKVFLEEVNLKPEFAFRLDTTANNRNLNTHSLGVSQKSAYPYNNNAFKVMGASDAELTQIYNKFSKFRTILPDGMKEGDSIATSKDNDNDTLGSESDKELTHLPKTASIRPKPVCETQTFIALPREAGSSKKSKHQQQQQGRIDIEGAFENRTGPRKEGELSMKEKIENYNKRVRDEPTNIQLWKEFINFQDKYFQEHEHIYAEDGSDKSKKKRRNKRALLEKKVAICDKALESNPRTLDLHLMRLNFLYTFQQPDFVLSEWKKLVTGNQQVTAYWMEYFRFASSQLQVYSTSRVTKLITKSFQKFRQMLSPKYPEFQRPLKMLLVINDVLTCLSLILRNAGYREKAIALHQAQLEVDFYPPLEQLKGANSLLEWAENKKMFEFFWDIGTPVIGENGAPGWCNYVTTTEKQPEKFNQIGILDTKVSKFEDCLFETINAKIMDEKTDKSRHWLLVESSRSKLQWLHWRSKCSDVKDIEDSNRIVLGQDVTPCVVPVPTLSYVSDFDRDAAYFRHLVNFLITLQEDFVPQTQTISNILNPFTSVSLTESRSLVSEIFYWRKILNFYVPAADSKEVDDDDKKATTNNLQKESASGKNTALLKSLVKTPESFKVEDWSSPNGSAFKCEVERKPNHPFDLHCPKRLESTRNSLLIENESNLTSMIHSVINEGIEHLSNPLFSSILFQMYLRFEQKNTVASRQVRKIRIKSAKSLLQKPPLRNSMGAYLELAMLEHYEGNTSSAIDIIIKTINLGCTTVLKVDELTGFVDIEQHWETMSELAQLYNRLAELHFSDKPAIAYHILTLLGSGFKTIDLDDDAEQKKSSSSSSNTNVAMLKAFRYFEKVLAQIVPGIDKDEGQEEENNSAIFPLSKEMLGRWDGDKCIEYLVQKPNIIVEWTRAFAMFQFLAKEKDFGAASKVYEKVLERIEILEPLSENGNYDWNVVIRHHIREQLYIHWCNLGAHVLSKDPMANSKFRSILGKGLQEFPSSPPLLLLFTDVENQMSIAGKLWRMMVGVVKQDGGCNHWAPLLMGIGLAKRIEDLEHDEEIGLTSFGLGGPAVPPDTIFYKLDSLLCAAQENRMTRSCPLVWRVHLKLLAIRTLQGKDIQRAKATFYEAIRHCPSSKSIYLDGVSYFPEMMKEATDLMAEKQLYTRMPLEELDVLLEDEGDVDQAKNNKSQVQDIITLSDED